MKPTPSPAQRRALTRAAERKDGAICPIEVSVDLKTYATRVLARNKTERNAEAFVLMAVMRRGVEDEIFKVVPAGDAGKDEA